MRTFSVSARLHFYNYSTDNDEPFIAVWLWHDSCVKCLYRELTGVDQEIHVLFRLVAVHGLPILELSLFCSGLNFCHYSPQGKHGNLHCSNVPELHAYLWNTANRASSILKAVPIKSTGLQLHDLQCNLFNDLSDCQLQLELLWKTHFL